MATQIDDKEKYADAEMLLKRYREIQLCVNIRECGDRKADEHISNKNQDMMEIVRKTLEYMKASNTQNAKKYQILYYSYLSLDSYSVEQVLDILEINSVYTFYKQRQKAIEKFSEILWGGAVVKNTAWNNLRYRIASRLPLSSIKRLISEFFPNYVLIKKTDKKKYQRYRQNGIFYAGLSAKHFWQTGNTIENRQVTCPKCKHKMDFENISPEENKLDKTINCPICKARMLLTTTVIFEEESYE